MSEKPTVWHCHDKIDELLADMQTHAVELASPALSDKKARDIAEGLAGCYTLFHAEFIDHVEAEERDVYPVLKERLADRYLEPMEALYVEHRLLHTLVTRLGFVLGKALRAECVVCFSEKLIASINEVFDIFAKHSDSEEQMFAWAGVECSG